jgi:SAM-dependent methyltransferase
LPTSGPWPAAIAREEKLAEISFNDLIHEERGKLLSELPKGARTFCSAGCAGRWYFDWVEEKYGPIPLHYGVELFSPKPDDLPPNVRWIQNSVADMFEVPDGAVDILFSGQNVEHLYLQDLEKFFREANRVVRPGGHLCVDSPNRLVSQDLGYTQPQHVLELSVQDIVELVEASGFTVESVKGIWSCADGVRRFASATELEGDVEARRAFAADDPQSSFIWWLVARKTGDASSGLTALVERIVTRSFPSFAASRFRKLAGTVAEMEGTDIILRLAPGDAGFVFYGPYVPLRAGEYQVTFDHLFQSSDGHLSVDVVSGGGGNILAQAEVRPVGRGEWTQTRLSVTLPDYTEGIETRLSTSGADALVRFGARIVRS